MDGFWYATEEIVVHVELSELLETAYCEGQTL